MNKSTPFWLSTIMAIVTGVITGLVVLGFTRSATETDKIKDDVSKCAQIKYVDKQDQAIRDEMKTVKVDQQKTIDRIDDNLKEIRSYILKQDK